MTWPEFQIARQLLAEERVGTAQREARAIEDEQFKQSRKVAPRG